jgi:bifunctional DNA-binding transcriptional regulator/antitoxin component of YhaV-PrlF toxin-antitoxin module
VIVRIAGEGQFRIPDEDRDKLNELDNAAVEAVEAGDEGRFQELWGQMLAMVSADGNALPEDELVESDIILPPRDTTIEEAQHEFTGEGLIPD